MHLRCSTVLSFMSQVCLQTQEDPRAGIAWVSGEGQVYCVSKGFMTLMGYSFQDLRRNIQSIGALRHRIVYDSGLLI